MAFRLCREIGCPHPKYLPRFGIGLDELHEWSAFFYWERNPDDKPSVADKMDQLAALKNEWDE